MFLIGSSWFAARRVKLTLNVPSNRKPDHATAFAPNDTAFIILMAIKGLGSACNTPTAIGIFSAHFPPGPKQNLAYGALTVGQAVGLIIGLVLGVLCLPFDAGYILADSVRRWNLDGKSCYMAGNIILSSQFRGFFLFIILGWWVLRKEQAAPLYTKDLDWGGAILSTAGFILMAYSLAYAAHFRRSN